MKNCDNCKHRKPHPHPTDPFDVCGRVGLSAQGGLPGLFPYPVSTQVARNHAVLCGVDAAWFEPMDAAMRVTVREVENAVRRDAFNAAPHGHGVERLTLGKHVAVVYSTSRHYGWSTWAPPEYASFMCLDGEIASCVLGGDVMGAIVRALSVLPEPLSYMLPVSDEFEVEIGLTLAVRWLRVGTRFDIFEHEGKESVQTLDLTPYKIA
jgi:hypothetical protein